MNRLQLFGAFIIFISLGFYAPEINSSLLGVDLSTASNSLVSLFRIGLWAVGIGFLLMIREVSR